MSKVIDLVPRLKTVNTADKVDHVKNAEIVNFDESKQKILFNERRQVKRTVLSDLVSSMVVIPEKGLLKVSLHDVSEEGVSFELEESQGSFKVGEEVSLRVYLNQKVYFPIQVCIKHVTPVPDEGYIRHGAVYLKNESSHVALQHFIKFVESIDFDLKNDAGDFMINRIS